MNRKVVSPTIRAQAIRFRVFAAMKKFMAENGEYPLASEIARSVGISQSWARRIMHELAGADGLMIRPASRGDRARTAVELGSRDLSLMHQVGRASRNHQFDESQVPVDTAIATDKAIGRLEFWSDEKDERP